MNNIWLTFEGAWQVLLAGLLLGAGLPALFALGVRFLAMGQASGRSLALGKVLGGLCFAVVFIGVLAGVGTIIAHGFGLTLTFDGLAPVFVTK